MLLLQACAYKPVIDTAGRSGTFNETKADQITNDIQHCKQVAKENSTFIGNIVYWSLSPTMDTKKESLIRKNAMLLFAKKLISNQAINLNHLNS